MHLLQPELHTRRAFLRRSTQLGLAGTALPFALNLAAMGEAAAFTATEQRWRGGLASAAELEDARRLALAAQSAEVQLQRERIGAWIALYKAAGGGWNAAEQAR